MKEVFDHCYFCHSDLKHEISETTVHGYPNYRYIVKHEPHLAYTKCNDSFQADPFQYEKTNMFIKFLESIKLKQAEIEYQDMMQYVDAVMKFHANE